MEGGDDPSAPSAATSTAQLDESDTTVLVEREAAAPLESEPSMPTHIGRYEVVRPIASGGMGAIYLGRDPDLDRAQTRFGLAQARWAAGDATAARELGQDALDELGAMAPLHADAATEIQQWLRRHAD
jgi:hypothetical protein